MILSSIDRLNQIFSAAKEKGYINGSETQRALRARARNVLASASFHVVNSDMYGERDSIIVAAVQTLLRARAKLRQEGDLL